MTTRPAHRTYARWRLPARTAAAVLCALGLVAAACSRPEARLIVGVKRAAIDLAFTDESIPAAEAEQIVIRIVPEEVVIEFDDEDVLREVPPRRPQAPEPVECPQADPSGRPARVVTEKMAFPPKAGTYTYIADGRLRIETTVFGVNVPFPRTITRIVRNVVENPPMLTMGVPTGTAQWQYEVVDVFGTAEMVRTYQLTGSALRMVRYERKVGNAHLVFVPHEGVTQYAYGSQGATWGRGNTGDERRVDLLSRTVMTTNGVLEDRRVVDLCGEWIDVFAARSFDEIVTLDASYSSVAHPEDGYLASYATHLTSLPVAEAIRFTEQAQAGDPPLPVTLEWRYTTRLKSLEPAES